MRLFTACVAVLAVAGACKSSSSTSSKTDKAPATSPVAAPGDSGPAARVPAFEVDGTPIEVGAIGGDIELLSLGALPEIDSWTSIVVRSTDGKEFQGTTPTLLTGTRTMKLVRLPVGYEFRVTEANQDRSYVRHKLSAVAHIRIFTKSYQSPATPVGLTFKSAAGEVIMSAEKLASIPRSPEPKGDKERETWSIGDILIIMGAEDAATVVISDASGEQVVLDQAVLADPALLHILKRNQRREFNYRAWKLGDSAVREKQLRGVTRIELR